MKHTQAIVCTLSLSLTALGGGCDASTDDAAPAVRATELAELAFAPILAATPQAFAAHGRFAHLAASCDLEPSIELDSFCGRELLASASYGWDACAVELPEAAPLDAVLTSGALSLDSELSGSCEGDAELVRTLELELDGAHEGVEMHTSGHASARRSLAAPGLVEVELEISRSVTIEARGGGPLTTLSGTLDVDVDPEADTRTASGVLHMSMSHPYRGERAESIELVELVRGPAEQCPWPTGGALLMGEHTLEFSEDCGSALFDGEPIELADLEVPHRGRP